MTQPLMQRAYSTVSHDDRLTHDMHMAETMTNLIFSTVATTVLTTHNATSSNLSSRKPQGSGCSRSLVPSVVIESAERFLKRREFHLIRSSTGTSSDWAMSAIVSRRWAT